MRRRLITLMLVSYIFLQASAEEQSNAAMFHRLGRMWFGINAESLPIKCGLPIISHALGRRNELEGILLHQLLSRPGAQKSVFIGNFRIHYDTTGIHEPAMLNAQHNRIPNSANRFADSVGAIANYCLRVERDLLGYAGIPDDNGAGGGSEYDIYVQQLSNLYGLTTPESPINNKPDGGTFTSFITIDNDFIFVSPDSNRGLPAVRVTVAHELHHAIQLGNYGYWTSDVFFYEITSVWMEDVVFTEVNDYFQYLAPSFSQFRRPWISFANENTDLIMYSRGIWGLFVAKKYGANAMRKCWEEIRNARPILAIDRALQQISGASLRQAFVEWATWNRFTGTQSDSALYYSEGRFYPTIAKEAVSLTSSTLTVENTLQPLSTRYYTINGQATLPVSNIDVNAAVNSSSRSFSYRLQLATSKSDESYGFVAPNIYAKIDVSDPNNWFIPVTTGSLLPFPNPLLADGSATVNFRVGVATNVTLSIFSSSTDHVYSATLSPRSFNGEYVVQWNGRNEDGDVAGSGVYVYVIHSGKETVTGKIALLRK